MRSSDNFVTKDLFESEKPYLVTDQVFMLSEHAKRQRFGGPFIVDKHSGASTGGKFAANSEAIDDSAAAPAPAAVVAPEPAAPQVQAAPAPSS